MKSYSWNSTSYLSRAKTFPIFKKLTMTICYDNNWHSEGIGNYFGWYKYNDKVVDEWINGSDHWQTRTRESVITGRNSKRKLLKPILMGTERVHQGRPLSCICPIQVWFLESFMVSRRLLGVTSECRARSKPEHSCVWNQTKTTKTTTTT